MALTPDAPPVSVGVLREHGAGERRVALVPEVVGRLTREGLAVLVERGAGEAAFFPDAAYEAAGATLGDRTAVLAADVLACVHAPDAGLAPSLHRGQVVVGLLALGGHVEQAHALGSAGVVALDLALLPRTLSRAQSMDALTSQASVAGYRAAIVAAEAFGRFFPMMITAAGTAKPARVLVLGTGVAGLQAIGTARRLGAQVTGYDIRPSSADEVRSLGATFLQLTSTPEGAGEGGYARELTEDERAAQQAELAGHVAGFDVVITTAQVPGRRPPVLVTADTVAAMRPGSVVVDLGASDLGGNVEGSVPDERVVTPGGATVVGAGNLAAELPTAASSAYARNVAAVLRAVVRDGRLDADSDDEVVKAIRVPAPAPTAPPP
ncbi:NAD(P) transhydrogenase subunit alpha [Luteimicrobium album]|uniref:proton-translocating NAD(P)(+) transhydrogenase n=1 Tax=Luteimicrobium album TaxID=1054550 RepID=A0ABQ6I255_9MICO|nr:NAD(P) transhydrogenase subunit alpha [Luteimicrobium album]GMA23895.1 NAD(P) transhydrogenase subunit alpha [Luteimicrobium album]